MKNFRLWGALGISRKWHFYTIADTPSLRLSFIHDCLSCSSVRPLLLISDEQSSSCWECWRYSSKRLLTHRNKCRIQEDITPRRLSTNTGVTTEVNFHTCCVECLWCAVELVCKVGNIFISVIRTPAKSRTLGISLEFSSSPLEFSLS